jgi:hypothetical protein
MAGKEEEIEDISSQVSVQHVRQIVEKTEEVVRWLTSML